MMRLIAFFAFCVLGSADAVTIKWTNGGGNNLWSTDGNWDSGTVPTLTDDVVFDGTSVDDCDIDMDIDILSLTTSPLYTGNLRRITGGTIKIGTFISEAANIDFSGTSDAVTITVSTNIISGTVNLSGGTITVNNVTVNGGVLILPGSTNTFNGDVNINLGTLSITNSSGITNFNGSLLKSANGVINSSLAGVRFNTNNSTISGGHLFKDIRFLAPLPASPAIRNFYIVGNLEATNSLSFSPSIRRIIINRDPIFVGGNFTAGTSIISNGTVTSNNLFIFNGISNQTVNFNGTANRIFQVGGAVFANTVSGILLSGSISGTNCVGGITLAGGALNDGGNSISLATNQNFVMSANTTLSLSGASLPVVSGAGSVLIHPTANLHAYGTNNLTLSNPYSFTNFTINKPTNGEVNLTAATSVSGMLDIQAFAGAKKLNTNGNLTLVSTAMQTASLIDFSTSGSGGSVNGNVKVQRFYQGVGRPKLFGTPIVSGATVFTIGEGTYKALLYTETGQEPGIPRKTDPTRTDFGNSFINAHSINGGNLSVGRGYSLRQNSNGLAVFDGVVNNGTINFAVTNTTTPGFATTTPGFNLMSNPYPSAIDWTLVNVNSTGVSNTAVSIFNGSTYTATNIIASGQGFFVKATSNGNITFSNTVRVNSNTANNTFLRTEEKSRLLYLYVKNNAGGFNDALTFSFNDNATNNYDSNFDLTKINSVAPLSPFLFSQSDGLRLSLDVRPFPTKDITIPITLRVNATSDYTFSTSNIDEWYADYSVFLKDSLNGNVTFTNLKITPSYVFSKAITDTDEASRFSVVLKYMPGINAATIPGSNNNGNGGFTGGTPTNDISLTEGTPDAEARQEVTTHINSMFTESNLEKSMIYSFENKVAIKFASNISNSSIEIIDLMGNKIFSELDLNSVGKKVIEIPVSSASIYFIKLTNNKENIIQKVFLY